MIKFEPTVSLGAIVSALLLLVTLLGIYAKLVGRLAIVESRVSDLWTEFISRRSPNALSRSVRKSLEDSE